MISTNSGLSIRKKGYLALTLLCLFYWVFDSVWAYVSFEANLKNLIFREPASWLDTFLLRVPPYQMVSRLMAVLLFLFAGCVLIEILRAKQTAETRRKETHDTLLTVLNSIDAAIYVAEFDTYRILFMNRFMIERYGGDFVGKKCHEAFRNEPGPCAHCPNERLQKRMAAKTDELPGGEDSSGPVVWEGWNPISQSWYINYDRSIRWIDGRRVHLQVSIDISTIKELEEERRRSEARLRQAHKMEAVGALAGGIAHDFNNILTPILGLSELLLMEVPETSPARRKLGDILRAGIRGRELVKQILTFSRQGEQEKVPLRMGSIVKEALKLCRASIPRHIEIHWNFDPDPGLVMADPTQIHQIVMNLVTNAYHAAETTAGEISVHFGTFEPEDGEADSGAPPPGRYAMLSVSDTGPGIPPEIQEKIFEPYFTTKERGKGTGIGLAMVHGIVREHGGTLRLDGGPGRGATFTVYLPLLVKNGSSETAEIKESAPAGRERILLVDDEPSIVHMETAMLEGLGYRVTSRTSGPEALALFEADPEAFDLAITDLSMPKMTGDQLAREFAALRPDFPVLVLTGLRRELSAAAAESAGIREVLSKPIRRADLARAVRGALDGGAG